jgi:hypothetical protein
VTAGRAVLPPVLRRILRREDLQTLIGRLLELVTIDGDGLPHPTLLDFGAVLAADDGTVRFALPAGGPSAANLRRTPRAALAIVYGPAAYVIAGEVEALPPSDVPGQARFALRVARVEEDRARRMTSGVTYAPAARTREVLADWQRALDALAR